MTQIQQDHINNILRFVFFDRRNDFKFIQILDSIRTKRGNPLLLFVASIDQDSEFFLKLELDRLLAKKPELKEKELDFMLFTYGGSLHSAYRIIRNTRNYFNKVNFLIPYECKSAGTLIALSGDRLVLGPYGELGPLDPQIVTMEEESPQQKQTSALIDSKSYDFINNEAAFYFESLYKFLHSDKFIRIPKAQLSSQIFKFISDLHKPIYEQIDPYKLGERMQNLNISEAYLTKVLNMYSPKWDNESIANITLKLVKHYPDHGFVLDFRELQSILSEAEINKPDEYLHSTLHSDGAFSEINESMNQIPDLLEDGYRSINVVAFVDYINYFSENLFSKPDEENVGENEDESVNTGSENTLNNSESLKTKEDDENIPSQ